MRDVLEYFDLSIPFDVPAEQAIDYFRAKGLKATFAWQDMLGEEHANAFTIAKMMDLDLLKTVQDSLDLALSEGTSFQDWADNLIPTLQAKGWWGRQPVLDPITGQTVVAQLGSPGRLQTIFRTNMQSSYAVGQWVQMQQQAKIAPFLMYDAIDDWRTRPEHAAWDGTLLPIDSPWWQTHYPPNGWNCRCSVIQLDQRDLDAMDLKVSRVPRGRLIDWTNPRTGKQYQIPEGVDPGFDYNPGIKRARELQKLYDDKVKGMPENFVNPATQAKREIEKALELDTPYLATAIKKIQASGKQMQPQELLDKAKEAAAKQKQNQGISAYKKAFLAEKPPSASALEAFDALPLEAQTSLTDSLQTQLNAIKAEAAAKSKLDELLADATPTNATGKAWAQLQKDGIGQGPAVDVLPKLEAKIAEQKAATAQASLVSSYKTNILKGKVPTEAQKAAFDALDETKKGKILAEIDKANKDKAAAQVAKQAEVAPTVTSTPDDYLDGANLTQIGPQAGSNPGGLFQDVTTGEKWYVKFPDSVDNARNEALASRLYELAGIAAPEYRLVTLNGREGIASKFVEGLEQSRAKLESGELTGIAEGFAVDAWLANWDVIGQVWDNMKVLGRRVFRTDNGGALRYRAQGGLKGSAFGDEVREFETLRDPRGNFQAASVFGRLSEAQIEESARRVLALKDEDIRRVIDVWGPLDLVERDRLYNTLIARKQYIYNRFPNARPEAAKPAAIDYGKVTAAEQATIEAARVNGFSIRTDSGEIEDHNVVLSTFDTPGGGKITRAWAKLLPEAGARVEDLIKQNVGGASVAFDPGQLPEKILELIKGINSRAAKGGVLEQRNIERWEALRPQLDKAVQQLEGLRGAKGVEQSVIEQNLDYIKVWRGRLAESIEGRGANDAAVSVSGNFNIGLIRSAQKTAEAQGDGIRWEQVNGWQVATSQFERSFATATSQLQSVPGVTRVYRAKIDGVTIDYVPFDGNTQGRAFQGTVMIDGVGVGAEVSQRVLEALGRIGVNTRRATDLDRQELYLNKHARLYTVRNARDEQNYNRLTEITDQAERVKAKLEWLNNRTGKKLDDTRWWGSYSATYQAFGHGRALQYRADLDDVEFDEFKRNHVLYTNPTGLGLQAGYGMWERIKAAINGGGMFSSVADRVRRGVSVQSGSSISADVRTGGGNYLFTRILKRGTGGGYQAGGETAGAGIYWKPEQIRRLDAITYGGDRFGDTTESVQREARRTSVAEWREVTRASNNETIFKDGISLFDAVQKIILPNRQGYEEAIRDMRAIGYKQWPDGRELTDVFGYVGQ